MTLEIGRKGWVEEVKALTAPVDENFWSHFAPCSAQELKTVEQKLGRTLPPDFVEFYRTLGYGDFSEGGGFFSPEEILMCVGAPIYFMLGSLFTGEEWCSEEEHRQLWLTRGAVNPAPAQFTDEALTVAGVRLYDLLQVGSNGCCCYHQLYVGPEPGPFEYCLLTDSQTVEDQAADFSAALEKILAFYLEDLE